MTYPGTDYFDYGPLENKPRYHVFVCFIGDVNRYIASGLFPAERDPPMIKINYADRFLKTITEVIDMIRTPCLKHDRTVLMLEDLMLQLHEQEEPCGKASSYLRPAFEKLMSEIRQKIQREWNFDREADSMNLSLIHFRRLFRQFSGLPPQQFLNQCRLQKASELLTGTDFNINEIAEQVGIGNAFYFSRLFKQKLKLSPLAYRKNFRGG
ncbi:MAG: hypothetical protein A2X49_14780 [Lentisphaerae bacterium GWF2_52_8]|nr:MAG: hypothetical protein A2X49_14780 [Lentisphaerae bacterium GWF2_52_8]